MSQTRNIQHGKNDTNNDSAQRYIGSKHTELITE